jgi:hypothetical protein
VDNSSSSVTFYRSMVGPTSILPRMYRRDTMAVPGFEHQTFMCSECQDVERRLVFTKQNRDDHTEAMPEQAASPVVPVSTAQDEHVAASGALTRAMAPAQTVSVEPNQAASAEWRQTAPVETTVQVETTRTVPGEPALRNHPPLRIQRNVWTKALEKLHAFKERAIETDRRAQFNRVWDSFRSVPPSSASSEQ